MKPLFLAIACVFLFQACSSSHVNRGPSSSRDEIVLGHLLASESPRQAAKEFVQRLLRIRLRSQAWLQDFDASLVSAPAGVDIFSLPAYRKLLVARPLAERTEAKIMGLYEEALKISPLNSADAGAREREGRAFLVLTGVQDALREAGKSPAQKVLLHDFLGAMREKFGLGEAAYLAGVFAPFQSSALGEAARKTQPEMQSLIRALPDTDDVKSEVEEAEKGLGALLDSEQRQPSRMAVFPSAGVAGNITGLTFPQGTFALTYDDGPHGTYTLANVRNLKAQGVKATFFWTANNARKYVPIVKAVQKEEMPLGNHSYMHADITDRRHLRELDTNPHKEVITSTQELTRIYGVKPKYYRLPYGAGLDEDDVREMIAGQGMVHVKWNIDSLDWQDKNPASIVARLEQQMRLFGRGIILFHDVKEATVPASLSLLTRQRGKVRWVTIPEIVDELNGRRATP